MTAQDYHAFFVELVKNIRAAKTREEFDAALNHVRSQSGAFEQGIMTLFGQTLETVQDPAVKESLVILMTIIEWNQVVTMLMMNPVALAGPELIQALQALQAGPSSVDDEEEDTNTSDFGAASSPEALAAIDKAFSRLSPKG